MTEKPHQRGGWIQPGKNGQRNPVVPVLIRKKRTSNPRKCVWTGTAGVRPREKGGGGYAQPARALAEDGKKPWLAQNLMGEKTQTGGVATSGSEGKVAPADGSKIRGGQKKRWR